MENKYYTPSIEEFCVGFEYERMNGDKWCKDVISPNDLCSGRDGLENEFEEIYRKLRDVRVKYLDKEDIESLGFIYIKSQPGLTEDYFELISTEWCMDYDYSTHYCRIFINSDGDSTFFAGTIKNKHELKRVLTMLGIV
jgi:hypothetical protein